MAAVAVALLLPAVVWPGSLPAQELLPSVNPLPSDLPPGVRRFRAWPRSDGAQVNLQWFPSATADESIGVITGGINVVVDGIAELGAIDLSTDRLVIWTGGIDDLSLGGESFQSPDTPMEFYMEGNIEFRQGQRVIYASSMYYDVRHNVGVVLDAEMLTPVPEYEGKLRVHAEQMRQIAKDRFTAGNAKFTTSRIGEPGYWLQAGDVFFEDRQSVVVDPRTGLPQIDPLTNEPIVQHERTLTGRRNTVYVGGLPVFYWPRWTTDLEYPSFYLKQFRVRDDDVFGAQILTEWNLYELLGIREPLADTAWDLSLDYLSERGPAVGTTFTYGSNPFPVFGPEARGIFDAYYIHDTGLDNLGRGQRALPLETNDRGRVLWQHQGRMANGYELIGQFGLISDRNFLEQYFEKEWDTHPDQLTRLALQRTDQNRRWRVEGQARLNDFFTQTEWLPRVDHYWLGQSLWADRLTWFEHSQAGYAKYRTASAPQDPTQAAMWALLPWEVSQNGGRYVTRQEIDLPLAAGPVKLVPYALGELAYWDKDLFGDQIERAYGQVGLRGSLSMWSVNPLARSALLNVNGLAHKVVFDAELAYTDASQNVTDFPLYDPIDDDSTEAFRRMFQFTTFGGPPIPPMFDPRFYAIRTGLAGWVSSPSVEVVDDLTAVRLGARQRWQTKRGSPADLRIIDWMTLDTNLSLFPQEEQNFGELVGLIDYDWRWHLGDRFSVLSSGIFDVFDKGQQLVNFGVSMHRPERTKLYLGVTSLQGPIDSVVGLASLSYRLGPKYIIAYNGSLELAGDANVVQRLALTRLGESFLFRVGVNSDQSKGSVGASLAVQPRLFRRRGQNLIEGINVPPAGAFGLE
ncbi:MAG: organic solvent tolerance protein OstA [Planctomycetota bacterium]|nr:organic solvent tolerance protein OstA [Planctomycetota bacterium]